VQRIERPTTRITAECSELAAITPLAIRQFLDLSVVILAQRTQVCRLTRAAILARYDMVDAYSWPATAWNYAGMGIALENPAAQRPPFRRAVPRIIRHGIFLTMGGPDRIGQNFRTISGGLP
jgi:hypothetical protein